METYFEPSQVAFAQPEPASMPAQEIDIDRLVWDREYRAEVQGRLKNGGGGPG